jgi:hypothetical protein
MWIRSCAWVMWLQLARIHTLYLHDYKLWAVLS